MRVTNEIVRMKASDEEFGFEMPLPESLTEAVEVFDEENVFAIFNAGLKVKLQNIAREGFREGKKTVDEINEAVASYRPGVVARRGLKSQAFDLVMDKNAIIKEDPDLHKTVREAYGKGDFKAVIELLQDL